MTRKHFKALAAALSLTRASLATCEAIAVACEASNPRFDRRRFILACATKAPAEAMPRTAWDLVS